MRPAPPGILISLPGLLVAVLIGVTPRLVVTRCLAASVSGLRMPYCGAAPPGPQLAVDRGVPRKGFANHLF